MLYQPNDIAQTDLDTAEAPYLGGEFAVWLTRTPSVLIGTVAMTGSGTGAYTDKLSTSIKTGGADLQLVATSELSSPSGVCTVVFNVLDESDQARTLTFAFTPPTRAADQSGNFGRGTAVDGVLSGGTKVKSITSLESVTNGDRGVSFALYQLPEAADYALIGSTTEKKFTSKAREPVGINSGMERDAFIKRGMTQRGTLTIDSKFGAMFDGLTRFNGGRCTAMLQGLKDGILTTERMVFASYCLSVDVNLPAEEGEAMASAATGLYKEAMFFFAADE